MPDQPASEDADERLAMSRLRGAVGSDFDVLGGDGATAAVALNLTEVNERPAPPGYEQYSALLRGPLSPELKQATYALRHPDFGTLPLFIVPVGRDRDGVIYEACVVRRATA